MPAWAGLWDDVNVGGHSLQENNTPIRRKLSRVLRRRSMASFKELVRTAIQNTVLTLGTDPLAFTNTSAVVTVTHTNHRLATGDVSTLSGIAAALRGVPAAELNAAHTVTVTTDDAYTITVTTTATSTGSSGGTAIIATHNNHAALVGDTALKTISQMTPITQSPGLIGQGGAIPIATIDRINRALVLADLTDTENVFTEDTKPTTYPADLSGNGGGGKLTAEYVL